MRVLDVGSGAGDVAFLVAELVGETGAVVGVDANEDVLKTARSRAERMGLPNVSFAAADVRDVPLGGSFDAVVGRLVLMYSADPAASLRAALRHVRPGGIAAFHEMNAGAIVWSDPPSSLHQLMGRCINEVSARAGIETWMGTKLHATFLEAGLEPPHMTTDANIGAGSHWVSRFTAAFGAGLLRSILPSILEYGNRHRGRVESRHL